MSVSATILLRTAIIFPKKNKKFKNVPYSIINFDDKFDWLSIYCSKLEKVYKTSNSEFRHLKESQY